MQIDVVSATGLSVQLRDEARPAGRLLLRRGGRLRGACGAERLGQEHARPPAPRPRGAGARGSISLFGVPSQSFQEWHRVGYLPQKNAALSRFFPATVQEIVALGLVQKGSHDKGGRSGSHARKAVSRAMELVDIADIGGRLIGSLSGGQQQRVLLARALVREPELLILDEPTIAIDPEIRERFLKVLSGLNSETGVTVLLVTHDTGSIGKYAKKLLYLENEVVFYGGFDEFCLSEEMTKLFGAFAQHLICHRHE